MKAPDGLQDRLVSQHAAGTLHQEQQQLELLRRQPDFHLVAHDATSVPINHQSAKHDRSCRRRGWIYPPQCNADPGEKLLGAKRLRHVVVGPGIERVNLVTLGAASGKDDHRRVTAGSNQAADFHAIYVG
jgi:hypothetical protein